MSYTVREAWLNRAVERLDYVFTSQAGVSLPKVSVSVGFPHSRKAGVIGECHPAVNVADGIPAVFVSPVLDDPVQVLACLTHELVHAVGNHGHRGKFVTCARNVGLVEPWTATTAGPDLTGRLTRMSRKLGPYPHGKVSVRGTVKTQTTRMVKVECAEDGYLVRATRTWLDQGMPLCGICGEMMEVAP